MAKVYCSRCRFSMLYCTDYGSIKECHYHSIIQNKPYTKNDEPYIKNRDNNCQDYALGIPETVDFSRKNKQE